jgi:hypothetical protein
MKTARLAIVLALMIAGMTSCGSNEELKCEPQDRLIGVNESAADRALTCLPSVEIEGVGYYVQGCFAVDESFLGPLKGLSEHFAARSIKGAPSRIALAFVSLDSEYDFGCPTWHVWGGLENTKAEDAAVEGLICRVHPPGAPVVPKRFCRQSGSADGTSGALH